MDAVLLSRIQFAFTIAFHFLFVPLSLGSAIALVIGERRFYKSGSLQDEADARFWVRLFTATFAIGVATGITMEFAFGTNWATYSRFVGDIFGAPLAAEGLLLLLPGIDLPGRASVRAKPGLTPVLLRLGVVGGYRRPPVGPVDHHRQLVAADARPDTKWSTAAPCSPTSSPPPSTPPPCPATSTPSRRRGPWAPSSPPASPPTTCARVATPTSPRRMMRFGLVFGLVMSLAMPFLGHWSALQVADTQPAKMAAFEGIFTTQDRAPLALVGMGRPEAEKVTGLAIPSGLSIMLGFSPNHVVTGLDQFAPERSAARAADLSDLPSHGGARTADDRLDAGRGSSCGGRADWRPAGGTLR